MEPRSIQKAFHINKALCRRAMIMVGVFAIVAAARDREPNLAFANCWTFLRVIFV